MVFAVVGDGWRRAPNGIVIRGYDPGMTTKIAVSLPDKLLAEAKAAVASGRAASVSAFVAEAMSAASRRRL